MVAHFLAHFVMNLKERYYKLLHYSVIYIKTITKRIDTQTQLAHGLNPPAPCLVRSFDLLPLYSIIQSECIYNSLVHMFVCEFLTCRSSRSLRRRSLYIKTDTHTYIQKTYIKNPFFELTGNRYFSPQYFFGLLYFLNAAMRG